MDGVALYFTGPRAVETRPVAVPDPGDDEVVVETIASAISAGTELLVYRGRVPTDVRLDETIDTYDEEFSYPLQYGYASVGEVVDAGVHAEDWVGQTVFSFSPHRSRYVADAADIVAVPEEMSPETATAIPTVETATTVVHDSAPLLGERVVVFGAGIVGLWTVRLLSAFPLERLTVVEPFASRRAVAEAFGADEAIAPAEAGRTLSNIDLAVELSGRPAVLDDAVRCVGYDGRVVVGSWYGTKHAPIDLGSRFHRNRVSITASQVSTIDPALRGRWDRDRRLDVVLDRIGQTDASSLISHRIPIENASRAYELLDETPAEALQVLLTY